MKIPAKVTLLALVSLTLIFLAGGCPDSSSARPAVNAAPAPAMRTESKVVILHWFSGSIAQKESEEARLTAVIEEGWTVVNTDTQVSGGKYPRISWTVTVTLSREVPVAE